MTDPDLAAALRDCVRDEHPDLHHLTAVSLREGTRIKRRRTAGIAAGIGTGFALVASTVLLASGLPGGGGDPVAELAPAVGASAEPAPETDCVTAPEDGLSIEAGKDPEKDEAYLEFLSDLETLPLCTDDRVEGEPGRNNQVNPPEDLQPLAPMPDADDGVTGQDLPVALTLEGWTCDPPADDKFGCTDGDGTFVSVVVRPVAQRDDWLGNPDKEGSALWVSPAHDNYFVTVQGEGFGQTNPADFIDGLEFADSGRR